MGVTGCQVGKETMIQAPQFEGYRLRRDRRRHCTGGRQQTMTFAAYQ